MSHKTPSISIALQGGGSHGAFTAGVLKRLFEAQNFRVEGISGTSSGAVNACLMAYGDLIQHKTGKSTASLENFWDDLGKEFAKLFSPSDAIFGTQIFGQQTNNLALQFFTAITQNFAPYQFNPERLNPLRDLLNQHIDFEMLRDYSAIKLFIAATNTQTSKLQIFKHDELTVRHILASACLPSLHHSVQIGEQAYWDGGFSGNPVIFPLIFNCKSQDIIIVLVQPMEHKGKPDTADKIRERISEIAFTSNFKREMRAITFSKRFVKDNWLSLGKLDRKMNNVRIHIIQANDYIEELDPSSRYNASPDFLSNLQQAGYACANDWLDKHQDDIGKQSSVNLEELFE